MTSATDIETAAPTEVDVSAPPNDDKNKCANFFLKLVHITLGFTTWIPLILPLVPFLGMSTIFLASFVTAMANINLNAILYKFGKTHYRERVFDVTLVLVFGMLWFLTLAIPEATDVLRTWNGAVVYGAIALFAAVFWMAGHPLALPFSANHLDPTGVTHPAVRFVVSVQTGLWMGLWLIMALIGAIPGIVHSAGGEMTVKLIEACDLAMIALLFTGIVVFTLIFPWYFFDHPDTFTRPFAKDIKEWDKSNPGHPFAHPSNERKYETR